MKKSTTIVVVAAAVIIIALVALRAQSPVADSGNGAATSTPSTTDSGPTALSTAQFACNAGKTMGAAFYSGTTTPDFMPNGQPIPNGYMTVALSDGRNMTLWQTISADGARYSNADGSFVFWNKGNGALVLENNQQQTYVGCIMVQPEVGNLTQVYQSNDLGITLRYPAGYTVDPKYDYQALGPGKDIYGVKFTIPASVAAGTNLSQDSYVSVEEIPKSVDCSAAPFVQPDTKVMSGDDNGQEYSIATSSDAGAGNRYEETVYALEGTNPCVAMRYFIHYGAIENYPAGAVQQFDRSALLEQFDQIRRTLTVNQ